MLSSKSSLRAILLAGLTLPSLVVSHTWIEQLMAIAPNGTMVGQPGFPRNNVLRTSPGFGDAAMVFLIPPNGGPANQISANQMMCRPEQTTQVQSQGSPRLKIAPGQAVALRYQENGHVTLPNTSPGKPPGSGANFVYFTENPKPDEKFLQIHRQWTADGTGGDGRGRLISTQNFDDGQCYQINGEKISKQRQVDFSHQGDPLQGQSLWCQQDIQIPADAKPGTTITLYWVWDWPTMPGSPGFPEGKQEIYTTCMDVDIVASPGQSKAQAKGFIKQDLAKAAVAKQFANVGNPTAIKPFAIPFSKANANAATPSAPATLPSNQPAGSTAATISVVPVETPSVVSPTRPAGRPTQATVRTSIRSTRTNPRPTAEAPSPDTVGNPGRQTRTVTDQAAPNRTRKGNRTRVTVTATQTEMVTVRLTETVANKRAVATSLPPDESSSHSTSEKPYRLRARNPFYIIPSSDQPSPTSSTSC